MFRKSLFLGLTAMLAAVLIFLVIQGRRAEKKQAQAPRIVEVVKDYKSTATRVIAPADLKVATPAGDRFTIHNSGTVTYSNPEVELDYFGKDNRVLEKQTHKVEQSIPPGQEIAIEQGTVGKAPEGTTRTQIRLRSAEIAPASPDTAQPK